jgi:uncharacterized protein YggE
MRKKLWLVLSLGMVLTVIGLAGCNGITSPPSAATVSGGIFNNQSSGIWVTGEGKVTVVPDVAVLSLGVATQASTVDQAQSQASASMNAVVSALKGGGVADKDIKTQVFNIQQLTQFDNKTQRQTIIGYSVTNTVTAKVRNVANAGTIIDAVTKAGGDNTRINSISFTVDDPTASETSARQLAMADAKAKAKQLADLAGVKLGAPTYINESGGFVPLQTTFVNGASAAPAVAPTPVSPGTTDITLTVQITYSIN